MSLIIHEELEQGTDAWLDQRRGMVTASVVGQLITPKAIKPATNDTARNLLATLVAERITGWTEPTYTTDDMWRGIEVEPIARDRYSQDHAPVSEVGFMVRDDWGYEIGYSPDGLVGNDGLIEIKAPRQKTHIKTHIAGEVPLHYMAQLQCGLLVSGRDWIDYVSYCGGLPMYVKRVTPDERWFTAIVEAVTEFEKAAAEMVAAWTEKTKGLVPTERIETGMEIVI